jgi:hypothetical protein
LILAFRDDSIKDDVTCVKKIFKETEQLGRSGFSAWVAWNNFCQGDLSQYKVERCGYVTVDSGMVHQKTVHAISSALVDLWLV